MGYVSALKLYLELTDKSLRDNVTGSFFVTSDGKEPSVSSELGYKMKLGQYLETEGPSAGGFIDFNISQNFIVGFWLKPSNVGVTVNPTTSEPESIRMSLLDFYSVDSAIMPIISIYEYSDYDNYNRMVIELNEPSYIKESSPNYSITSSSYLADQLHYFWIEYNVDSGGDGLNIYIDGTLCEKTETGTLTSSLNSSQLDLYVNRMVGYGYNRTSNYGHIKDLIVLNNDFDAMVYLERIINHSTDFAFSNSYIDFHYNYGSLIYDDPLSVQINAVINDIGFVYLAMSDGRVLRGSPLMWQNRRVFSNPAELNALGGSFNKSNVVIQNGFLKIKNSTIRL
jgi:hypothetical protein